MKDYCSQVEKGKNVDSFHSPYPNSAKLVVHLGKILLVNYQQYFEGDLI